MKKMIISIVSIFLPFNIVFAQSPQQKVDSLKRVEIQAAKAQQRAEAALRQEMTDANYQAAKAAKERHAEVSSELEARLRVLEEEARRAAEEARRAAEEARKKEDKRIEALYHERFPEFEVAGISKETKDFIIQRLRKDNNWDIVGIKDRSYSKWEERWYVEDYKGDWWKIPEPYDSYQIKIALQYRKDPVLFYEAIARQKMKNSFKDYYLNLTGKSARLEEECSSISVYQIDILKDKYYYKAVHYYDEKRFVYLYRVEIKPGTYFQYICKNHINDPYFEYIERGQIKARLGDIFVRNVGLFFSFANRKPENGQWRSYFKGDIEYRWEFKPGTQDKTQAIINDLNMEPLPKKLIKVFKAEDYL